MFKIGYFFFYLHPEAVPTASALTHKHSAPVVLLDSPHALDLLIVEAHAVGTSLRQPLHLQSPVKHALPTHLHLQESNLMFEPFITSMGL